MKKFLFYIAIILGAIIIGFVLLNGQYFWKQIRYFWHGSTQEQVATTGDISNQEQPEVGEPNQLNIPSLEITAPIQFVDEINEDMFQRALQNGVVHYPGTAEVGQSGNTYIFGHSSDFALAPGDYKTVFALLPHIKNDAEIIVSDAVGQVYRYKVYDQFVAENTDMYLLEQNTDGRKILTLQTSYPVGTALKRYIVKAELIE